MLCNKVLCDNILINIYEDVGIIQPPRGFVFFFLIAQLTLSYFFSFNGWMDKWVDGCLDGWMNGWRVLQVSDQHHMSTPDR